MAKRLNNNRYEILQEIDATPFTRIYKAKILSDTSPPASLFSYLKYILIRHR